MPGFVFVFFASINLIVKDEKVEIEKKFPLRVKVSILNCNKSMISSRFLSSYDFLSICCANSEIWQPGKRGEMRAGIGVWLCDEEFPFHVFQNHGELQSLTQLLLSEASPCRVPFTKQEAFCSVWL